MKFSHVTSHMIVLAYAPPGSNLTQSSEPFLGYHNRLRLVESSPCCDTLYSGVTRGSCVHRSAAFVGRDERESSLRLCLTPEIRWRCWRDPTISRGLKTTTLAPSELLT